ncbi:MAG: LysE family translocator [Thiohalomonadales bacterium]
MDSTLFISFLIVSIGLIIIPGPNVLIIVSTSLTYGKSRGLQTVAGTSLAMFVQLIITGISTSLFIQLFSQGFYILKYLGIVFLLYLGLLHLKYAVFNQESKNKASSSTSFSRGFQLSLSNPKTIVFFSAFLPQFVSSSSNYLQKIGILSITYLLIATVLDSCYVLLSLKLKSLLELQNLSNVQNGFSAFLFISASIWLEISRRLH